MTAVKQSTPNPEFRSRYDVADRPTTLVEGPMRISKSSRNVYLGVAIACSQAALATQTPQLLRDIHTQRYLTSARIESVAPDKNTWFLAGEDVRVGREILRMAGDPAKITPAIDMVPGTRHWNAYGAAKVAKGLLFFTYDPSQRKRVLWTSQGTRATTSELRVFPFWEAVTSSFVSHGHFWYALRSGTTNYSIWKTDGTKAGTKQLNFEPFSRIKGAFLHLQDLPNGKTIFTFYDSSRGYEPWVSDGTPSGTFLLADTAPGIDGLDIYTHKKAFIGNSWFFRNRYRDRSTGKSYETLWKTDGTKAGTKRVFVETNPRSTFNVLGGWGGKIWFGRVTTAHGRELWASDGTTAGTSLFMDVFPGSTGSEPYELVDLGKRFLFTTTRSYLEGAWISDGTLQGTKKIADLKGRTSADPRWLTSNGKRAWFFRRKTTWDIELWTSDGTANGTKVLNANNLFKRRSSSLEKLRVLGLLGDRLVFMAYDTSHGYEPWVSDGTIAGTYRVNLGVDNGVSSYPSPGVEFFGNSYFTANDANGSSLWKTDGTKAGTSLIRALSRNTSSSRVRIAGPTRFWFEDARKAWSSDGTTSGTFEIPDINLFAAATLDDRLVCSGKSFRLVKTNANDPGVTELTTYPVGNVCRLGDRVYFMSNSNGKIWLGATDGNKANTKLLFSHPSFFGSGPLTEVGGVLMYAGKTATHGVEPWVTDGTLAGTRQLADLEPGTGSSNPRSFVLVGTDRCFIATTSRHGQEVWKTRDTRSASLLFDAPGNGFCTSLTAFGKDRAVFAVERQFGQYWVYKTDGTPKGTIRLSSRVYVPRSPRGDYDWGFVGARYLFFRGTDVATGDSELWQSDGSVAGTRRVADLNDVGNSDPTSFSQVDGKLVFRAFLQYTGFELWSYDAGAASYRTLDGCRAGSARVPELFVNDPVLGSRLTLSGRHAKPALVAAHVVAAPATGAIRAGACRLAHDPRAEVLLGGGLVQNDGWNYSLTVPTDRALHDVRVIFQSVLVDSFQPIRISLSNAVRSRLATR